jgi:hypothetical protein
MASPFQQQSLQRKLIYIGLIVVLFTASWVFRRGVVEAQANELALREENIGEVELTGSAVRLTLTGSRGLAVCILWMNAIDKQKKNQWDELEMLVGSVTRLQPHFMTPWLFQSWNLSYNVAVKCDAISDQYFYISRGMELLAEGERQNQYQPELRHAMGNYYQQKICQGDRKITLQSLLQMSSIPPELRDPRRFEKKDGTGHLVFNEKEFAKFCQDNPRLARRLHEQHRLSRPEDVVTFLKDNYRLPSRFEDRPLDRDNTGTEPSKLKSSKKRFPVLPPPRTPTPEQTLFDSDEYTWDSPLRDNFDGFVAARAWYGYSVEPLPPPNPDVPGENLPIKNRTRQRLPKQITTLIFRHYPARTQSYIAEFLEDEGWFDGRWEIQDEDSFSGARWPARLETNLLAVEAWRKAHTMWKEHGRRTGQQQDTAEQEIEMGKQAEAYAKKIGLTPGAPAPPLRPEQEVDSELREGRKAYMHVFGLQHYLSLTNFKFFYYQSQAEQKPETVAARKVLFEAQQLHKAGRANALEKYQEFLPLWVAVLQQNPEYATNEQLQEDAYDAQWTYLKDYMATPDGKHLKQQALAEAYLAESLAGGLPGAQWRTLLQLVGPESAPLPLVEGPLDAARRVADKSQPLITEQVRKMYRIKKGLIPRPETPVDPEMLRQLKESGLIPMDMMQKLLASGQLTKERIEQMLQQAKKMAPGTKPPGMKPPDGPGPQGPPQRPPFPQSPPQP